jgi:hypothetical protein
MGELTSVDLEGGAVQFDPNMTIEYGPVHPQHDLTLAKESAS